MKNPDQDQHRIQKLVMGGAKDMKSLRLPWQPFLTTYLNRTEKGAIPTPAFGTFHRPPAAPVSVDPLLHVVGQYLDDLFSCYFGFKFRKADRIIL